MRKKTVRLAAFVCFCSLAIASCTQQQGNTANETGNTEESYQTTAEGLAKYVEAIYGDVNREFANEIQMDLDSAYCSAKWNAQLAELHKKLEQNPDKPIDFFSVNYWIMGQDALNVRASNVEVEELSSSNAVVSLDLSNFGSSTHVQLNMINEGGEWKIDNFIDKTNDIDWAAIMNE